EPRAPARKGHGYPADADGVGDVAEARVAVVAKEPIAFVRQIGHENIGMTVVVEVAEVRPHAGERFALLGKADTGYQSTPLERAVALVAEEEGLNRIVGHVHIDESVTV